MILRRVRRPLLAGLGALSLLYLVLLIPEREPSPPPAPAAETFVWNQDERWHALERLFAEYRTRERHDLDSEIHARLGELRRAVSLLALDTGGVEGAIYAETEEAFFSLAPMVAASPERAEEFLDLAVRIRSVVKERSREWSMEDPRVRRGLYRLLYGTRAAVEEVLLQMPRSAVPQTIPGDAVPSVTPSAKFLGVEIHSGDILVSRGGAPTSALIARGNDYQGNFSHVALLHIDAATGEAAVIESHIERGVAVASLEEYMRDVKLRVMILRLRGDLPALIADPLLPHRAAAGALAGARRRHIPYDFAMDAGDTSAMFCSEVVLNAYARHGVALWKRISTISTPGIRSWLGGFGVRHFTTQEPSDLEYDPQLRVVAEWRDPETLLKDHIDNGVIEALLEGAERGDPLDWSLPMLPLVRVMKGYSAILNLFGGVGPVPEGMSATSALRHRWLAQRHAHVRDRVVARVEEFQAARGYVPPYWQILEMAREERGSGEVLRIH